MKIAIAHASLDCARVLTQVLAHDPGHRVLWSVRNGAEALRKVGEQRPELLLLDVCLSAPSGVEITRQLLARKTCAILLVADRPQLRMSEIYEAMGLGALDVVTAPTATADGAITGVEPLLAKLRTVGKMLAPEPAPARDSGERLAAGPGRPRLVAIGASTGGPQALYRILSELPANLAVSLVIAQHVDSEFCAGLADWLQQATSLRVALATPGCCPTQGTALLAASNDHLVMTARGAFAYTQEPQKLAYRPSVDVLLGSLAEHWPAPGVAVLLTGMGRDGARGLRQLRDAGWCTIAQDEASSVVFGMPKAAIELGAAAQVLPLSEIARAIARACY